MKKNSSKKPTASGGLPENRLRSKKELQHLSNKSRLSNKPHLLNKSRLSNKPRLLKWIELSQPTFNHNIKSLVKLAGKRKIAVSVKANAYGHGLPQIVSMLIPLKAVEYITVHEIEEAIQARFAGWDRKILLLGPFSPDDTDAIFEYDIEPTIFDKQSLNDLGKLGDKFKRKILTHLKLETGTNRQGITDKELPQFADIYLKYRSLTRPYGASMHFANIEDTTNHDYAEKQLIQFKKMLSKMNQLKIKPKIKHTASSAATILFEKTKFDMVRPGISAYGHWPSKETYLSYRLLGGSNNLFQPILSFKTRISQIKNLPSDSFIGYGCTYRTTSKTKLAVIPVGYADGYGRELSNLAYTLINGQRAPIRGRICMNLAMVDITDIKNVKIGDIVTLIGNDNNENISVEQLANLIKSINYEILARFSRSITRQIIF